MASIRARLWSRFLRKNIRDAVLPDGYEGLKMARAREGRVGLVAFLMRSKSAVPAFTIDDMQAEWVGDPHSDTVLLYLHGGGYMLGSINTHRSMATRLCRFAGIRGLIIDYRLAPENPFPAAIDDAEKAYDFLIHKGVAADKILLAGDSAGGGLSLALLQRLRDNDKALPKAVALMSPWTDLTLSGKAVVERAERDPMIDATRMPEAVEYYCANHDKTNPLISPVFADLTGFPPLFVQVGTEEVLFDDSTRLVENAKKANVEAELQVWEGMPHVHQIAHAIVPESKAALRDMAGFFRRKTA